LQWSHLQWTQHDRLIFNGHLCSETRSLRLITQRKLSAYPIVMAGLLADPWKQIFWKNACLSSFQLFDPPAIRLISLISTSLSPGRPSSGQSLILAYKHCGRLLHFGILSNWCFSRLNVAEISFTSIERYSSGKSHLFDNLKLYRSSFFYLFKFWMRVLIHSFFNHNGTQSAFPQIFG